MHQETQGLFASTQQLPRSMHVWQSREQPEPDIIHHRREHGHHSARTSVNQIKEQLKVGSHTGTRQDLHRPLDAQIFIEVWSEREREKSSSLFIGCLMCRR